MPHRPTVVSRFLLASLFCLSLSACQGDTGMG